MILKNPELLLLDSPTVGIEPSKQMEMWNTIERIKASKDVNENFNLMLISNDQYEIDTLSDSITVIKHGTVLYKECNEKVIKDYAPGYNVNVLFEVNEMDVGTEQYENIYNDLALLMERSSNALRAAAGINPSLYCRYIMLARFLSEIKESSEKIILKEIKNDFSFTIIVYRRDRNGEAQLTNNINLLQKLYSLKMNGQFSIKELTIREEEINDIHLANERFNSELQLQIEGKLPVGHIYKLGMPGILLRASGFPNLPIELSSMRLLKKSKQENHIFDIIELRDLVKELNNPWAIFRYNEMSKNIIVGISHDDKQFLVGISFNYQKEGIEVSDIRSIFPKTTAKWLNWISQGKADYLDKEKIQTLIIQQRTNFAEVNYLDLNSIANIIENFENPNDMRI